MGVQADEEEEKQTINRKGEISDRSGHYDRREGGRGISFFFECSKTGASQRTILPRQDENEHEILGSL